MSYPPSLRDPDTQPPPSTMSEFDSLSDSEWLDISSGRDSDDESLSDHDSDHDEIRSLPRSRRSSISNDDSVNSDVEAWEGFVSDGGEEPEIGMYPVHIPSPLGAEPIAVGFVSGKSEGGDHATAEEDQRVKQALDQSFVGTLNNSRSSNTGPSTTSVRDLRLSFPDPLNSTKDELNRSYEDVPSPTNTTISASTEDDALASSLAEFPLLEDPGLSIITPAVQYQHHEVQTEFDRKDVLQIVLYGSSSEVKWRFLQELIQKALITSGHVFVSNIRENEQTQSVQLVRNSENSLPFFSVIHIHDRTINADVSDINIHETNAYPSLAVVYLPAAKLPVLSSHNAYLPVVVPSITDLDEEVMSQAAEDDWDLLAVPARQTLRLGLGTSPLIDAEDIIKVDPTHAYQLLKGIGSDSKKTATALKPLTERVKSMNAATLFALMSIIVGFAFNASFRPSAPTPTRTVNPASSSNGHMWNFLSPQPHRSLISAKGRSIVSNVISPSPSLKDTTLPAFRSTIATSLSVTSPGTMSVIIASSSKAAMDITSPTAKCNHCEPKLSTDMVLHSAKATSLAQIPSAQASSPVPTTHSSIGPASTSVVLISAAERSLSTPKSTVGAVASAVANIKAGAVSDVLDKALSKAVGRDLADLAGRADELIETLREQRNSVIRQSKGKARAFGDQIQTLNDELVKGNARAKSRAKMLRRVGESLAHGVQKELVARSDRAQKRAKQLREAVADQGAEAWKSYEKSVGVWESVLSEKTLRRDAENTLPKNRGCRKKDPGTRWPLGSRHQHAKTAMCV